MAKKRKTTKPSFFTKYWVVWSTLLVILAATIIFLIRNRTFFSAPNFYAEDATVLFSNIYTSNPLRTLLTPFNGYLIVGQYVLAYIAVALNFVLGNQITHLPTVTAIVSCAFLGLVASLPFILFKKELGVKLSLVTALLTAFVPIASYDYAIIGTISNMKFVFLYIAFMFIVYRCINLKRLNNWQLIFIDALLFLCVLTNVTVAFMLPLILVPYVPELLRLVRIKRDRSARVTFPMVTAFGIAGLSVLYVIAALLKGIPKIPGYMDSPFQMKAFFPIIDRSTFYGLSYPITSVLNTKFVVALLAVSLVGLAWFVWQKKSEWFVAFAAMWSIALGTGLFVMNRPGVAEYYLSYVHKGGPDQFFFAQNMVFIFLVAWLIRNWVKSWNLKQSCFGAIAVLLYLLLALPYGSSYGGSAVVYKEMKPIVPNIEKACTEYAMQPKVIIQIYPSSYWQWQVDKNLACK